MLYVELGTWNMELERSARLMFNDIIEYFKCLSVNNNALNIGGLHVIV